MSTTDENEEYLRLWNESMSQIDNKLAVSINSLLATQTEKISADDLVAVQNKQETILRLRKTLKELDAEYENLIIEQKRNLSGDLAPPDDRKTKIIDFLVGIVVASGMNFGDVPSLNYLMKKMYQ